MILFKVEKEAKSQEFREHTCLYFLKNLDNFKVFNLLAEKANTMPDLRLQVDLFRGHYIS